MILSLHKTDLNNNISFITRNMSCKTIAVSKRMISVTIYQNFINKDIHYVEREIFEISKISMGRKSTHYQASSVNKECCWRPQNRMLRRWLEGCNFLYLGSEELLFVQTRNTKDIFKRLKIKTVLKNILRISLIQVQFQLFI